MLQKLKIALLIVILAEEIRSAKHVSSLIISIIFSKTICY